MLLLVLALVLDFLAPPPVHGGAATLGFIAANKANYVAEQILWILPVLVFAALFTALSVFDKSLALVALTAVTGVLSAFGIFLTWLGMLKGTAVFPRYLPVA
ncbi:hypothetical protein ACFVVC_00590 [Pseudarthrobacter sp. NPDC058196]|uniref:hypothetical protein n=1 Tax=Pseudarthrobacter sp. NPDC058196 TaxID=3346376 RepID=UPI0036D7BA02